MDSEFFRIYLRREFLVNVRMSLARARSCDVRLSPAAGLEERCGTELRGLAGACDSPVCFGKMENGKDHEAESFGQTEPGSRTCCKWFAVLTTGQQVTFDNVLKRRVRLAEQGTMSLPPKVELYW